jgi:RsiW-degrading membrane proteinase PrsW (M82 family)
MFDPPPPPDPSDRIEPGAILIVPPPALYAAPKPPRKWLGPKGGWIVLAALVALWLYVLLFAVLVEHGSGTGPTTVLLGGFAVASALTYTLAYRLQPEDGLSVARLLIAVVLGGLFSTIVAATIEYFVDSASGGFAGQPSLLVRTLAGVIEEACKIGAVILMSRGLANKSARNGLFLGGAVGLGFSAFEDMSYDVRVWYSMPIGHSPLASVIGTVAGRGILGPMEHPVFTALLAAAVFAAVRNGRFRITLGVIGAYLGVAAVHGLIDSAGGLLRLATNQPVIGDALGGLIGLLLAIGSGIVWLRVSRRLRRKPLTPDRSTGVNSSASNDPM